MKNSDGAEMEVPASKPSVITRGARRFMGFRGASMTAKVAVKAGEVATQIGNLRMLVASLIVLNAPT